LVTSYNLLPGNGAGPILKAMKPNTRQLNEVTQHKKKINHHHYKMLSKVTWHMLWVPMY